MSELSKKRPRNQNRWPSARLNNDTFLQWELYFKNVALNVYRWENLPETVDPRWLELILYEQGFCLFFKDEIAERFLSLQCTISGKWDVYNIPIYRRAYASNGYHYDTDNKNSVLIWNNYTHTPTQYYSQLYALRVAEIERAIDVNVKAQKTPVLLRTTEQQRLSMKNFYMQYDGNEPFIFADLDTSFGEIQAINTQAPFVAPGLFQLKQFYINEFLSLLGVENSNQDKKAQMTAKEIGANYGQIEISRYTGLQARQECAKQINDMFGLDVKVNVSSRLETLVNRPFIGISDGLEGREPSDDVNTEITAQTPVPEKEIKKYQKEEEL